MRNGKKFMLFILTIVFFSAGCDGNGFVKYQKAGDKLDISFRANADSILLVYRAFIDTTFNDSALFLRGEKGHFKYTFSPKHNTNLIEYYFEDMNGERYPGKKKFYAVFFRNKGKELRNANFNYIRDLYRSGIRDKNEILRYLGEELKLYPDNYSVYLFLDRIKYDIPDFHLELKDMIERAKKDTPGFYRTFVVIMSRYNMRRADSLFEVMLHKNVRPLNMIEYFGRVSRDTAYISHVVKKFPAFSYLIYKNCFLATVKYRIFNNYDYYYKKVISYKMGEKDSDVYRAAILSKRGDPLKAYEKLGKTKELSPNVISIVANKIILSRGKRLDNLLSEINTDKLTPSVLNGISYEMAIHGLGILTAEEFIKEALKHFTLPYSFASDFFKPYYKQKYDFYTEKAYMLDTYGYILVQEKRTDEAKSAFEKAINFLRIVGDEDPTILEHYSYVLEKQKVADDSLEVIYGKILSYGKNEDIRKKLYTIYVKKNGDNKGFNQFLKRIKRKYKALKRVDRKIKNYELRDVNNRIYHMRDFKGKVIVITVFKSECGFCKAEAYDLRRLQDKFKGSRSVVFMDITPDDRKDAITFSKRYRLTAITVPDAANIVEDLEVVGTPTTFVVGRDGRINFIIKGYFTDYKDILENIIKDEWNVDL